MNSNKISHITQAITKFDIQALDTILSDDISYMNISKSKFLEKIEQQFNEAKKDNCHSFDDVFFGICGSCNKGCEGMTFLSNTGYYLDLFIESNDGETADDIYVCNQFTNFTGLDKRIDLGFDFYIDEEVLFKPTLEYSLIKKHYEILQSESKKIKNPITYNAFVAWYSTYQHINNEINDLDFFTLSIHKLYSQASNLASRFNDILAIKKNQTQASEALLQYEGIKTEREQLIWFYKNQDNHYNSVWF